MSPATTSATSPLPTAFEPEFMAAMRELTEERISFNKVLGLELLSVSAHEAHARMVMKPELVGHFAYQRIHGGAISAGLDSMGGVAVMGAIAARHMDEPVLQRIQSTAKVHVSRTSGGASIKLNRWGLVDGAWLGFNLAPLSKTISHTGARGVCMSSGGRVRVIQQEALPCTA